MNYQQAMQLTILPRPLTMDEASTLAKLWREEVDKGQDRIRLQEAVIDYVNAHEGYLNYMERKGAKPPKIAYEHAKRELWEIAKEISNGQMRGSHPRLLGSLLDGLADLSETRKSSHG